MIALELPDAVLEAVAERIRIVVREELEAHANGASPWLDAEGAADYCSMTVEAIKSAEKRGQLKGYRSETGRVRYRREDLDTFLRGGDQAA